MLLYVNYALIKKMEARKKKKKKKVSRDTIAIEPLESLLKEKGQNEDPQSDTN